MNHFASSSVFVADLQLRKYFMKFAEKPVTRLFLFIKKLSLQQFLIDDVSNVR